MIDLDSNMLVLHQQPPIGFVRVIMDGECVQVVYEFGGCHCVNASVRVRNSKMETMDYVAR